MQRLTNARYRFGSYTRGDLRGDILYGIFSFAGIEAFLSPQFSAVKDGWLQRHKERLPEDKTAVYEKELPGLMTYAAEDENYFEAAAGKVMALRRKIFASFVREAFFRDAESAGLSIDKADIDQGEQLLKWMEPGKSALLLFQDPRYYPLLLKDIKEMQKKGVKLQMAVSQTEEGIFPLREWMEKLLPDESVSFLPCEGELSKELQITRFPCRHTLAYTTVFTIEVFRTTSKACWHDVTCLFKRLFWHITQECLIKSLQRLLLIR